MEFTKMEGIGNDYIYINAFKEKVENPNELAIKLSDRHFGIGGDGLVLICPSKVADFKMRMFNADGSEGKMCGNASRCIGKYVFEKGLTNKTEITLETLSGIKELKLRVYNNKVISVTVDMGKPIIEAKKIPVNFPKDKVINEEISIKEVKYNITCVSMGNPHCILFMDEVSNIPIEELGRSFENNKIFPDRVNTEFVKVINNNTLEMRVWERGSGETLACGTGACAAVVAAVLNGYCKVNEDITVILLGGKLSIRYSSEGKVFMTGPSKFVFEGRILDE